MIKKVKNKICCIFNYPPHYRYNIYKHMDNEFNCDFYFGDIETNKIKKFDFNPFSNKIKELRTIRLINNYNWIVGAVPLIFKGYKSYILTGEPYCVSTWIIIIVGKLLKKKIYLWSHGWYGNEGIIKKKIKKLFFYYTNGVFLYSQYSKNLMIAEGLDKDKLHVIYNSLNYDLQISIRNNLKKTDIFYNHFLNYLPIIIFTGRLTSVKKIDMLIQSHKKLDDQNIKFNVVILGNGPESNNLKMLVNKLELNEKYWFYGECYNEEKIGELYYNSTICISPGNVGLTAIHSMMYGCPVITHDNFAKQMPEFESIIPNTNGLFFKYEDIESLAETIRHWIKHKYPKDLNTINSCYKIVDSKYNPNLQIELLKQVLNK